MEDEVRRGVVAGKVEGIIQIFFLLFSSSGDIWRIPTLRPSAFSPSLPLRRYTYLRGVLLPFRTSFPCTAASSLAIHTRSPNLNSEYFCPGTV